MRSKINACRSLKRIIRASPCCLGETVGPQSLKAGERQSLLLTLSLYRKVHSFWWGMPLPCPSSVQVAYIWQCCMAISLGLKEACRTQEEPNPQCYVSSGNCWAKKRLWAAELHVRQAEGARDPAFLSCHPYWSGIFGDATAFELPTVSYPFEWETSLIGLGMCTLGPQLVPLFRKVLGDVALLEDVYY